MAESHSNKEVKKSPKKMIMIIAIVVLLIGAGAGGYFYMNKASDAKHAEGAGQEKHGSEEHTEEAKHEEVAEPDVYYDLPTPLIVDFPAGGSAKVIKVSLTMLVKGESSVAVLKKHEPMIRNNLLMAISAIGADKAKTTEGKQELRALMLTEIGKVLEKMAGKNTVKDVYFTEFVMQ
jgi:flagellar FliL protein